MLPSVFSVSHFPHIIFGQSALAATTSTTSPITLLLYIPLINSLFISQLKYSVGLEVKPLRAFGIVWIFCAFCFCFIKCLESLERRYFGKVTRGLAAISIRNLTP